jgi:hypothetical protein
MLDTRSCAGTLSTGWMCGRKQDVKRVVAIHVPGSHVCGPSGVTVRGAHCPAAGVCTNHRVRRDGAGLAGEVLSARPPGRRVQLSGNVDTLGSFRTFR